MAPFIYTPLYNTNHIRLVTLYPGTHEDDEIKCSLQNCSLPPPNQDPSPMWSSQYVCIGKQNVISENGKVGEEKVYSLIVERQLYSGSQYDALSYAWGDPTPNCRISLNGKPFFIANNLHAALRSLRMVDPRILWIDAICIDQNNTLERSQQVQRMRQIFSSASSVLAWLGESDTGSAKALQLVKDMNLESSSLSSAQTGKNILEYPDDVLNGLSRFWSRSWWERIWIVQEVVAAAQVVVICGRTIIPWAFLRAVSDEVQKHEFFDHPRAKLLRQCEYRRFSAIDRFRQSPSMTLLQLLRSTRSYKATDPRDKVYALLGLASDIGLGAMNADYSKSVAEVYQSLVRFMIDTQSSLDIISSGRLSTTKPGNPTWLPDWELSDNILPLVGEQMDGNQYRAAGASRAIVDQSRFPVTLETRGICVDQVDFLGGSVKLASEGLSTIRRWEYIATEFFSFRKDDDSFWRTIIADKTHTGKRANERFGKAFRPFIDNTGSWSWDTRYFSDAVSRAVIGRRFFITRQGRMGLAPFDIQIGDLVCVLGGCQVPLILRNVEGGQFLVGEAYIHEIMDGEVMEGFRQKKYKSRTFSIK